MQATRFYWVKIHNFITVAYCTLKMYIGHKTPWLNISSLDLLVWIIGLKLNVATGLNSNIRIIH